LDFAGNEGSSCVAMPNDSYQYQIQQLPPASIPGDGGISSIYYGNNQPIGQAVAFPTSTPSQANGNVSGGGGGGGDLPTVDLALCDGNIARVSGYIIPP